MKEILAEKNAIKNREDKNCEATTLRVERIEESEEIEESEIRKESSFLESLREINEELLYEEESEESEEEYNEEPSLSFDPDEF